MKSNHNSSVAVDLLREMHADIARNLGVDLSRESEKACRVVTTRGIAAYNDWIASKLPQPKLDCDRQEYRNLRALALSDFCKVDGQSTDEAIKVAAFASCRQLYSVFRKFAEIECLASDEETVQQFWKGQEEDSARVPELLRFHAPLLDRIAEKVRLLLPDDCNCSDIIPDIGPGQTWEKRDRVDRPGFFCDPRFAFRGGAMEHDVPGNRSCCVPKDYRRPRLIFIEPSSRMLIQKGLMAWMVECSNRYPLLRSLVSFTDQDVQRQKLRQVGVATIDLSDASDRVNRLLVWRCFRHRPVLRALLFRARSKTCDSKTFTCFSTMGNATTFTTMTILLAAVVLVAYEEVERLLPRGSHLAKAGVFGDDILVDERAYGDVVGILGRIGLIVNTSKSFCSSPFVESCGLDLYLGRDVTPLKIKGLNGVGHEAWSKMLSYANTLFHTGYWRAGDVLVSEILSRWPKTSLGPYGDPDCLWSCVSKDVDGPWNKDYQRFTAWTPKKSVDGVVLKDDDPNLDYYLAHGRRVSTVVSDY